MRPEVQSYIPAHAVRDGMTPASERQAHAELHLPLRNAEVKASGVLEVAVPPPGSAVPGRIPLTLKVVKPRGQTKERADLIVYAGKIRPVAMLNPSAVNCRFAFSPACAPR